MSSPSKVVQMLLQDFCNFLFLFLTCAEAQETQRNAIKKKKKNTAHSTEQCSCCGATASLQNAAVVVMYNMFNVNYTLKCLCKQKPTGVLIYY